LPQLHTAIAENSRRNKLKLTAISSTDTDGMADWIHSPAHWGRGLGGV
jgi:hypothetical protein